MHAGTMKLSFKKQSDVQQEAVQADSGNTPYMPLKDGTPSKRLNMLTEGQAVGKMQKVCALLYL